METKRSIIFSLSILYDTYGMIDQSYDMFNAPVFLWPILHKIICEFQIPMKGSRTKFMLLVCRKRVLVGLLQLKVQVNLRVYSSRLML